MLKISGKILILDRKFMKCDDDLFVMKKFMVAKKLYILIESVPSGCFYNIHCFLNIF